MGNKFEIGDKVLYKYRNKKYKGVVTSTALIVKSNKWEYTINLEDYNSNAHNVPESKLLKRI